MTLALRKPWPMLIWRESWQTLILWNPGLCWSGGNPGDGPRPEETLAYVDMEGILADPDPVEP